MLLGSKLRREIDALFTVVPDRCSGDEVVIICPIQGCGDRTGNRSINLKNGKTNCWRCNRAFSSFEKMCRALGLEVSGDDLTEPDLSSAEQALEVLKPPKLISPVIAEVKLPRGFTPLAKDPDSIYTRLIADMAERKHLSLQDFEAAGVGFTKLDPRWEPYAIFPVREWGRVVYFQGRLYQERPGEPTKRFPARHEAPLSSRYWVYNLDAARQRNVKVVVVVESILNVLSLERKFCQEGVAHEVAAVGVFKHAVSTPQAAKLRALRHVREFCFMFDADATDAAWKAAANFQNFRAASVAELPAVGGNLTFDPNDDAHVAYGAFLRRKPVASPVFELAAELGKL
jgi:hypothetical protein